MGSFRCCLLESLEFKILSRATYAIYSESREVPHPDLVVHHHPELRMHYRSIIVGDDERCDRLLLKYPNEKTKKIPQTKGRRMTTTTRRRRIPASSVAADRCQPANVGKPTPLWRYIEKTTYQRITSASVQKTRRRRRQQPGLQRCGVVRSLARLGHTDRRHVASRRRRVLLPQSSAARFDSPRGPPSLYGGAATNRPIALFANSPFGRAPCTP